MSSQVKIVAVLLARRGKTEELRSLLDEMVAASRVEPCNLRYDLWQDQTNSSRFVLDELYADTASVTAHRESQHFHNYLARINDLADRTVLVLDPLAVA